MAARKTTKPTPIPPPDAEKVCSVCGCNWALHGSKDPTLEDCIRLLKAELETARMEKLLQPQPIVTPYREEPSRWGENIEKGRFGPIFTSYVTVPGDSGPVVIPSF